MKDNPSVGDFIEAAVTFLIKIIGAAFVLWLVWNDLMPSIFSLRLISYREAMMMVVVVSVLIYIGRKM